MNRLQRQENIIFMGDENKHPKRTSIFTPSENYLTYLENNFHAYILPIGVCQRIRRVEKEMVGKNIGRPKRVRIPDIPMGRQGQGGNIYLRVKV